MYHDKEDLSRVRNILIFIYFLNYYQVTAICRPKKPKLFEYNQTVDGCPRTMRNRRKRSTARREAVPPETERWLDPASHQYRKLSSAAADLVVGFSERAIDPASIAVLIHAFPALRNNEGSATGSRLSSSHQVFDIIGCRRIGPDHLL